MNDNIKKLTLAGLLIALGVASATCSFPVGASRCSPVQHMVNVLAAVLLGPAYGVGMAFVTSLLRIAMATGTLLAFPGSMVGALLCGLAYRYTKSLIATFAGEIFGTGVLGAMLAYPIAAFVMGKESAIFAFVIPFLVSSVGGALIALLILGALSKTGVLKQLPSARPGK